MNVSTLWLIAIVLVNVLFISLLIFKPVITSSSTGKMLVFIAFFILPIAITAMGTERHLEQAQKTEFCLSCHEMEAHGKSLYVDDRGLVPAVHFQNNRIPRDKACYTCHTDYTMFGNINAKMRGLKHLYVHYFKTPPQTLKLYERYNNRECLYCHAGARSFEEGATHNQDPATLPRIRTNELSCLSSDCHGSAHRVDQLNTMEFWQPGKPVAKE